ncbi:MAG: hexosaminidase, partial [Bacteroidia bacterium]
TSFSKGEQVGNVSEKYFPIHKGVGAKVIYRTPYDKGKSAGGQYALIDLNYGMLTQGDAAWQQFNGDIEVDLVFSEAIEVEKLEMTTLRFTISGTYPPEYVTVLGSVDGKSYKTLGKTNQLLESHIQGRNKVLTTVNFQKTQLKSIRVIAKSINPIPEGHHKVGTASRIMVDEVVVY